LAHEIKIPHTIAITRYLGSVDKKSVFDSRPLGIDMIVNSSEAVKDEIMETIETTGPSEVATFSEGQIILVGYQVGEHSPVLGRTIAELAGNGSDLRFFVAVLVRKHVALAPRPEIRLEKGDYLYLITTREHLPDFNTALKVETIKTRTAVIYGDNFLSQLVAGALLNRHFHVTLLARSEEKAAFFRNRFGNRRHCAEIVDVKPPSFKPTYITSVSPNESSTKCMPTGRMRIRSKQSQAVHRAVMRSKSKLSPSVGRFPRTRSEPQLGQ